MIKNKWAELSNLAIDLNSEKFTILLDYIGHVNCFALACRKPSTPEDNFEVYSWAKPFTAENLEEAANWLSKEYDSDN